MATQNIPENRRSGGSPWDDVTVELERVRDLAEMIDRMIAEFGPEANSELGEIVTPMTVLKLEIDYLDAAVHALYPNWHKPQATVAGITDEQPRRYTRLLNSPDDQHELADAIYSVKAIGRSLEGADNAGTIHGLAGALVVIGERLETALMDADLAKGGAA